VNREYLSSFVAAAVVLGATWASGQQAPVATFKSAVDLVRVTAVVHDRKGKFADALTARDFEILEGTSRRPIIDFQRDTTGGVSLALLFDVSGSMESRLRDAREAANHLLAWLDPQDELAIYTFDTALAEVMPFTRGLKTLPASMSSVVPFGATSLNDAIARTAEQAASRDGRRHAVAVLTDGRENSSQLSAADVSAIASAIDVPVYIFAVVASIDNPTEDAATPSAFRLAGPLEELASQTGGRVEVASTPAQRSIAARQIIEELRHQYLIAFESSGKPGWHPLVVRANNKDLIVRARNGYIAGQSRPNSF
jgi:Ca-activated chloride channel family protein